MEKKIVLYGGSGEFNHSVFSLMKVLKNNDLFPIDPELVISTSSGFYTGLICCLKMDFRKISRLKTIKLSLKLKLIYNLLFNGYIYDDDDRIKHLKYFIDELNTHLEKKISINMTFKELCELYNCCFAVTAIDIDTTTPYYLSAWTTPNVTILDGYLATTAIAPIFKSHKITINDKIYNLIDGGYHMLYPWYAIDRDYKFSIFNEKNYNGPKKENTFFDSKNILGFNVINDETINTQSEGVNYTYFWYKPIDIIYKIIITGIFIKNLFTPNYILNNTITIKKFYVGPLSLNLNDNIIEKMYELGVNVGNKVVEIYKKSDNKSFNTL